MTTDLNPAQHEAVYHGDGPLLILAGAGSGKTRVITYRIGELLRRGVSPQRILAVTFTNKAAGEMRERVSRLVGGRGPSWIGTFHATCARILRSYAERAGLKRDFVILDDGDQKTLVGRIVKEMRIADRYATPRAILSGIDQAKNRGERPEKFIAHDYLSDIVARVYPRYEDRLRQSNAVDFGDLILKVLELCEAGTDLSNHLAECFQHVLVDEFQDTNRVQYRLVHHLASGHGNLCVVGDDDQSIYRWRGADLRNILDFERDHPDTHVVKLEQNYRSTKIILDAANGVIARNTLRKDKRLFTEHEGGEPVFYFTAEDERSEAQFVVATLRKLENEEGRTPEDFAVFYRTHAQSRALEEALLGADIPYVIVGGTRFYDRAEIKDLLCYLRILCNPDDEVSLERVINKPARGIGDTTYERLSGSAQLQNISVWESTRRAVQDEALTSGTRNKLQKFVALIEELQVFVADKQNSIAVIAEAVLDRSGYLRMLAADGAPENRDREENLLELIGSIRDFSREYEEENGEPPTLGAFLERISLVAPSDSTGRGVQLMTVHAAKGLEFPVVFVTGLEDGVFPRLREGEDLESLEEERRLAYVAITRARERLFLTNARARQLYGQTSYLFAESRFLRDLPANCVVRPVPARAARPRAFAPLHESRGFGKVITRDRNISVEYDEAVTAATTEEVAFQLGQRVRHARFGEGEVRGFTGQGSDLKLTVYFSAVGAKTIIARFVETLCPSTGSG